MKFKNFVSTLLAGAAFLSVGTAQAASCCGGGSSSALLMPKMSKAMLDASFDMEHYDGYWNDKGIFTPDPAGSDLSQYRINFGYAHRLGSRWQASVAVPYIFNDNQYSGLQTDSNGLGDMALNVWYEAFDGVTCVWKVKKLQDLKPATYFGATLTVPTGISPYDEVANNFDITGRGLYRLDGNFLVEKTIYPWSASAQFSYGQYVERSVNRENGKYVEPYKKQLGDRFLSTVSLGYTQFLDSMNTITYSIAYADLREEEATVNGIVDTSTGMKKRSRTLTAAYATMDRDWVFKASWSPARQRDGRGENFPVTSILTLGVTHVLR